MKGLGKFLCFSLILVMINPGCLKQSRQPLRPKVRLIPEKAITKVEVKEQPSETQIIIYTTQLPTYSLFKATNPHIVLLDMDNIRFSAGLQDEIQVNNGLIARISLLNNRSLNMARLRVLLETDTRPYVTTQENNIILHLTKKVVAKASDHQTEKRPTPPPPERPKYTGQKISLDFQEADIHTVLRILAEVSHLNIVTAGEVKGKVTIRLINVPWDQALDIILKSQGLGKERIDNILRVAPLEYFREEKEKLLAAKEAEERAQPLVTKVVPINYADAASIQRNIRNLIKSEKGSVNIDERTNTVIIRDYETNLQNILSLIEKLDTPTPQVAIHARIVEVQAGFDRAFGIEWGSTYTKVSGEGMPQQTTTTLGGTFDLPIAGATGLIDFTIDRIGRDSEFILNATLEAMEQENKARTISAPKVTTLDNKTAIIKTGSSIPYATVSAEGTQTQLIDAVTQLEVTPHITPDDYISMHIRITKNAPGARVSLGTAGEQLQIDKKEAETDVLIKDGDTLVIGGIYITSDSFSQNRVPFLGSIPILNWLFRNETQNNKKNELLFFITPRIIRQHMLEAHQPSNPL